MRFLRSLAAAALVTSTFGALAGCYGGYVVARPAGCYSVWVQGRYGAWGRWHPGHWRCA